MTGRTMVPLDREEALALLDSVSMGRIVFTRDALPAIRPVNHALIDGELVIRTHEGALARAVDGSGTVVAYEADLIDQQTHLGWSVVVTGFARLVSDPAQLARYEAMVDPWVSRTMEHFVDGMTLATAVGACVVAGAVVLVVVALPARAAGGDRSDGEASAHDEQLSEGSFGSLGSERGHLSSSHPGAAVARCGRPIRSPGPGPQADGAAVSTAPSTDPTRLLRRGFVLEYATVAWNVVGIVVLAVAAVGARSVALAGFGLDSLIEIGASTVVVWELSGTGEQRQRRALRMIGAGFGLLALYLLAQSTIVLVSGFHPGHSPLGIVWTALTAAAMFALAAGKARTGAALGNPVLATEGRVTLIDGLLATAVLLGLVLNAAVGWWWADPLAGYVLVYYALREVNEIFRGH